MRGLTVAVVGSVAVHALVLAIVTARDVAVLVVDDEPPTPVEVPTPSAPPPNDPPPIEVVFLDTGATDVVTEVSPPASQRGRVVRRGAAGSETPNAKVSGIEARPSGTAGLASGTEGPPSGTEGPPARSPYLTMRKPGDEGLQGVSGGFLDDFLSRSKPLPPPPDIPGERVGDEIADLRRRLKRAGRYSPDELAALRAELVARTQERDAEELKADGGGTFKAEKRTFDAKVAADGTVKIREDIGGMDKFMKEHGQDPYRSNKLNFLDRTRDQRVAIGKRYRAEELGKSVIYMQQHIARLWAMTADVARRKQGLFELWDECAETGTPEEIAGGEAARAFVMSHIRGTVTYTAAELRALNAQRHSKQVFAP